MKEYLTEKRSVVEVELVDRPVGFVDAGGWKSRRERRKSELNN